MKKKFKILSSHIQDNLTADMEKLSEKGWELESFDVAHDGSAITYYAVFSSISSSQGVAMALEHELEDIPVSASDDAPEMNN